MSREEKLERDAVGMSQLMTKFCFLDQAIQAADLRRTAEAEREARTFLRQGQSVPLAISAPRPSVRSVAATHLFPRTAQKTESASSDSDYSSPSGSADVTGGTSRCPEGSCGIELTAGLPTGASSWDSSPLELAQAGEDARRDWEENVCEEMQRFIRQTETEVCGAESGRRL